jgi:heterodisulfide reductase subunit C
LTSINKPLRKLILADTGQDLRKCRGCLACDLVTPKDTDISFGSLVQLILMNDDSILTSEFIWDDSVLTIARHACNKQLDLQQVIKALREEKKRREVLLKTES